MSANDKILGAPNFFEIFTAVELVKDCCFGGCAYDAGLKTLLEAGQ